MPLDTQGPPRIFRRGFNGFDHAVESRGADAEGAGNFAYATTVLAVDDDFTFAEEA